MFGRVLVKLKESVLLLLIEPRSVGSNVVGFSVHSIEECCEVLLKDSEVRLQEIYL